MSLTLKWLSVVGCVGVAAFLAYSGSDVWGWFLLVAVILS